MALTSYENCELPIRVYFSAFRWQTSSNLSQERIAILSKTQILGGQTLFGVETGVGGLTINVFLF